MDRDADAACEVGLMTRILLFIFGVMVYLAVVLFMARVIQYLVEKFDI